MAKDRSLIGTYLGKYKIEGRLGRGGMAEVYKAYQANLERYVALKLMHAFLADDGDFLQRFQREALAMAATKHPNIASVYDFEAEDEYYYIVMEYLSGGSLKDRMDDAAEAGELLSLDLAVRVIIQMSEALAFAHSVGMIHRDIKPANIMFNEHDSAVLTDFGIAKLLSGPSHTATGSMIGTPAYMSPEQGLGEAGDERSDIYSLGVLFYHLTTGRLPHEGDTPLSVVLKHVNDIPERPCLVNSQLPTALEDVILRAMEKDPDQRYQRAGDMARELRVAAQQESLDGLYDLSFSGGRGDAIVSSGNQPLPLDNVDDIEFYKNLQTPLPGADLDAPAADFDESIEFFAPDGAQDLADIDQIADIEAPVISTTSELSEGLTQISRATPPAEGTMISRVPLDSEDVLRVPDSQDEVALATAVSKVPVSSSAASAAESTAEAVDMSALTSVLAGLSENTAEPGTGAPQSEASTRHNQRQEEIRQKRTRKLVGQGMRVVLALAGVVLGYYVWATYFSSASSDETIQNFNAQINELTGGETAEGVDLSGLTAEEPQEARTYLLSEVDGTAIVLELDPELGPTSAWLTVVQQQFDDGSWQNVKNWRTVINSEGQAVWPVDDDLVGNGRLYRWVIVDQDQGADSSPVALSDPFLLPLVVGDVLTITAALAPDGP